MSSRRESSDNGGGTCLQGVCHCRAQDEAFCAGSHCNLGLTRGSAGLCGSTSLPPPVCAAVNQPCGPTQGLGGQPAYCCPNSNTACSCGFCKACIVHGATCTHAGTDMCCTRTESCVVLFMLKSRETRLAPNKTAALALLAPLQRSRPEPGVDLHTSSKRNGGQEDAIRVRPAFFLL